MSHRSYCLRHSIVFTIIIPTSILVISLLASASNNNEKSSESIDCKEQTCVNGYCDVSDVNGGTCKCHPCWSGPSCEHYDDFHEIQFMRKKSKVYLNKSHLIPGKSIIDVKAFDGDASKCGDNVHNCSCAMIHYKFQRSSEEYLEWFGINSTNGMVTIVQPQQLEQEYEYPLTIIAYNPFNETNQDKMILIVTVKDSLNRIRRQAEEALDMNGMTFGLRTVAGETNSLQVGNSIHYKLEVALPKGPSDLVLEIRTLDTPMSNRTSLSLYNFTMPYDSPGIQFNLPDPKFHLSNRTINVFDRMTLDFGTIKNNGPDRNIMTVCFSVVLIRKPKKAKKKHTVEVGVEFSKGTMSWVAASEIQTASLSSKDDTVFCEVDIVDWPKKISLASAVTFKFNANLQFRSDPVRIELNKSSYEYEPDNLVSLGSISIAKFGKNFQAIPNSPRLYASYKNHTVSPLSYSQSVLDMNTITNNGEKSRTFINNPDNNITFVFSVYALNYEENIGRNVSFTLDVYIGRKSYFNRVLNLTIVEPNQNEQIHSILLDSSANITNQNLTQGGITQVKIKSRFEDFLDRNVFTDYQVIVNGADSVQMPLVPCAARLINEESGWNLPYLNPVSIKPIREDKKFIFNFGRLNFIKLVDAFSLEDNIVSVELTFRAPFDAKVDEETKLQLNMEIISGYKTKPVTIENNEISLFKDETGDQLPKIEMNAFSSVKWNDFIVRGGVAFDIELNFEPNTAYQDLQMSIMKDATASGLPELNICRFSVVKVSQSMPCTCVERDTINSKQIQYDSSYGKSSKNRDKSLIDFGSISVVNGSEPDSKQKILTNFVVMIKEKIGSELLYPIKIDVVSNKDSFVSDVVNLNISEELPTTVNDMSIDLEAELMRKNEDDKQSIIPGLTTNILIKALTVPYTMGPLTIEVYSENEMLSICGLWVHRIGYNLPCVDHNQTAEYDFTDYGQNRKAILHFDMITNFGNHIRKSERDERNDNTMEFVSMVRLSEQAVINQTLKIKAIYGQKNITIIKDIIIPVGKPSDSNTQFSKPRKVILKTVDDNQFVHRTVPKLFMFDIELEENSQTSLSIMMDPSNVYKMCSASFINVGKNYPCYSPFSLNVLPNKFELGMICNTYLNKMDPEDNRIRLAFALRPNENIPPSMTMSVSGMVYVGHHALDQKNELSLSVDDDQHSHAFHPINKGAIVEAESTDNIGFKIRERKWIVFNIRIPAFSTGKLTAIIEGQADANRAFIVFYDLKIISGGQNIPCPLDNSPKLQLNSTTNTNQMNLITADLGWFSNFGYTYQISRRNHTDQDRYNDDILKIQILTELTDHPSLNEDDVYKLHFKTIFDNTTKSITSETTANINLVAIEDPNPKLEVNMKYKKRMPVLDRNETFTLTATIKHLPESNAEPSNPVLRMFTQNFVEILAINSANTKELPTLNKIDHGSTDIVFPWILFNEEFVVNFTVQIDPRNIRGYGRKEMAVITPFRMMCQHFRVNSDSKFPCSQMKHINYRTESTECDIPLGMESGTILDGQISASSTIANRFSPKYARPSSNSFWSPSIRNWNSEHYYQIDFRKKTRLVRLIFKSIGNMRKIGSYHINYSNDGKVWYQGTNTSHITYNMAGVNGSVDGESYLQTPIEARLVRLIIDSTTATGKESKNQYIAVKFELYGCYLDKNHAKDEESSKAIAALQIDDFRTHYTDDVLAKNRHISIDPYTNVIYFCDAATNNNHYMCYYSDSGGNSWNVIGRSIDSFEGFELATGKFYAIDYDRPAYFYSADGANWTPIDFELFNATISHPKFQKKIIIPRYTKEDVDKMDIRFGNWRANYEGLNYEDYQLPKAFWSKCCGIE